MLSAWWGGGGGKGGGVERSLLAASSDLSTLQLHAVLRQLLTSACQETKAEVQRALHAKQFTTAAECIQ